jgi:hypothetical protein
VQSPQHTGIRAVPHSAPPHCSHGWTSGVTGFGFGFVPAIRWCGTGRQSRWSGQRIGDTPEMVLQVYGHLMPDREDTTRKAVDAAWRAAGKPSPGEAFSGTRG